MRVFFLAVMTLWLLSGCATWGGIKSDVNDGYEWSKEKVNKGAQYVKEKTE